MIDNVNGVVFGVFIFLFLLVTVLGFAAARWRRADLDSLDEWGLGGRGFGTFIAWFLIGGDIYTAYTFIAVPATLYAGSAVGFFAVPYTIVVYPLIFLFLPRLWSVSHRHGYVTPADFVQGRYDSRGLALVIALTGILATMPYIALQLVGMQVVLQVMGIGTDTGSWFVKDLPLFIAFVVLAAYTYSSGLRAPALIAFVKDTLIYIVILVAVFYIPSQIGGWDHIFQTVTDGFNESNATNADAIAAGQAAPKATMPPQPLQWAYASLALGSALALFMYPHSVTGVLSTRSRSVIRRNAALLPAYSFLLGLLALLGFVAIAAGVKVDNPQQSVPQLFEDQFSPWFAGVAFAAIVIGALVPAAIMSIAAANLWTRNVYRAFINRSATPKQEATQSKLVSLLVKFGALVFVLALSKDFAINLQLLGGVWILQTLPAIVIGLYTRWMHRWALFAGWAAGMAYGTWLAYGVKSPVQDHFGGPLVNFPGTETKVYIAVVAVLVNLLVSVVLTVVLRAMKVDEGVDQTRPQDFHADAGDPGVEDELSPETPVHA
ncbi:sodium:solute symporter [Nocardioides sp. Root1257]|uniref:monocarboxylate uptake permease MctP n=1 Tax=unclassified Nocardioides TaxID=2615069 RepID=UPI0006F9E88F|nr:MULTISPECIES: sodium:solute symporter [unclassified Nocardioides]KQW47705.1 sodium:solute symporter [Nocardioides sp. Root1257]KRC44957.1 sodium:solute symporter [Nocardioides sp. Root224]